MPPNNKEEVFVLPTKTLLRSLSCCLYDLAVCMNDSREVMKCHSFFTRMFPPVVVIEIDIPYIYLTRCEQSSTTAVVVWWWHPHGLALGAACHFPSLYCGINEHDNVVGALGPAPKNRKCRRKCHGIHFFEAVRLLYEW